jgi:hypothetical protein
MNSLAAILDIEAGDAAIRDKVQKMSTLGEFQMRARKRKNHEDSEVAILIDFGRCQSAKHISLVLSRFYIMKPQQTSQHKFLERVTVLQVKIRERETAYTNVPILI